jgi:tripartite-type tricarboxylate transporter receptor subunit TctC
MIVGSEVGGGYDLCGRTLARHLERTVPGLRVDVKNVPQASGKLAGKMLQEGPTDGSMIFTSTPGLLSAQVLGEEGVAYDLAQWSWLGKVAEETRFLVSGPGADFKSLEELRAKKAPSPLSVRSKSSYVYHEALWLNALLGIRIKPIPGYKAVEKDAALLNGEVMLTSQTYPTDRKIMDLPEVDVVLRITEGDTPERFKDRPLLSTLVADKPHLAPLLRFMSASGNLLRWFAAPPRTEPDVVAEWRKAFDATVGAPGFVSEAGKLDFNVKPMTGAAVGELIGSVLADQYTLRSQLAASLACGQGLAEGREDSCGNA